MMMLISIKQQLKVEVQFMRKLSNTETELKKSNAFKKEHNFRKDAKAMITKRVNILLYFYFPLFNIKRIKDEINGQIAFPQRLKYSLTLYSV